MTTPVAALIFDMDGTLVDNMPAHTAAWADWHANRGLAFDVTSFFGRTAGRTDVDIVTEICPGRSRAEIAALIEEKQMAYRARFLPERRLLDGCADLIAAADRLGVPCAVATAAPLANIDFILDGIGIRHRFKGVISPALGLRGKPHPDMFVAAAETMGTAPAACLVFEDAPLGVQAAKNAGMRAIALTTTLPAADFAGFDNVIEVRPDYCGIDLAALVGRAS